VNDRYSRLRLLDRFRVILLSASLSLFFAGCAAKVPPVFFPQEPAPPRIQLLTNFNNQGSLRNIRSLSFLLGEDLGDRFSKAYGMAFHDGILYVADSGKASTGVAIVDFEKKIVTYITDYIRKPFGVAVDDDGTLYVSDLGEDINPSIHVFDAQHNYLKSYNFPESTGIRPLSILLDGDNLLTCGDVSGKIHVLDKYTGKLVRDIDPTPKLGYPVNLSKTPDGNILVTETLAQTLRLVSPSGEALNRIGQPGDRSGNFVRPKATAVDRDGYIYCVDIAFQNVQIFNSEGQVMMDFGSLPDAAQTLVMPAGIALNYDRMDIFQKYAAPDFKLEYVVAVSSQGSSAYGSKVTLYGFGKKQDADYSTPPPEAE